ncbi:MAG: UDP-N-acetylmuramoyl-L-alanine--D-glutamate ligase [Bacillota bacterium]|nr:UDP-N-acetylmuramoyl-L-alanine--D-glutamate ligase [Bacillota bacterium]
MHPTPEEWRGRKVAVVGLGISNLALIRLLRRHGARVEVRDQANAEALGPRYRETMALGATLRLGPHYLEDLTSFDTVFVTPGIPKDLPQLQGLPLSTEIDLVFRYCRAPIIGITGSAGKSTTTRLVGDMCSRVFPHTYVGGNLGRPLVEEAPHIPPEGRVVLELSSFQLELLPVSPVIAGVLNFRPNHLDIHRTLENYARAKKQIYRQQKPQDWIVFNRDDPALVSWWGEGPGKEAGFSRRAPVRPGVWLLPEEDEAQAHLPRYLPGPEGPLPPVRGPLFRRSAIPLRGVHNEENVLAASALALLAGVPEEAVREAIPAFRPLPHRLEVVAEKDGILFINDSIATSPDRTLAALEAMEQPVILLAGGYDKGLSFDPLAPKILAKVKVLILMGRTADAIEMAVRRAAASSADLPVILRASNLEEGVELAVDHSRPGQVVLLSPASASFDMFPNFEARGEAFRLAVHKRLHLLQP